MPRPYSTARALPPTAARLALTTAVLQENKERAGNRSAPFLLTKQTLASAVVLCAGCGNTAGNSAKRGTGQPGRFILKKNPARRVARPPSPARVAGQGGRPRNASFPHRAGKAGTQARSGPVRSAQDFFLRTAKAGWGPNFPILLLLKPPLPIIGPLSDSCPFPAVLLRHCARSVPEIF